MKYLLIILFCLGGVMGYSQKDTSIFYKDGKFNIHQEAKPENTYLSIGVAPSFVIPFRGLSDLHFTKTHWDNSSLQIESGWFDTGFHVNTGFQVNLSAFQYEQDGYGDFIYFLEAGYDLLQFSDNWMLNIYAPVNNMDVGRWISGEGLTYVTFFKTELGYATTKFHSRLSLGLFQNAVDLQLSIHYYLINI